MAMSHLIEKTRFCPSPTGQMHFGNARTALFSALYAASQQGVLLLRIEDTDQERSKAEYTEQLMADLQWLGIDWQEGGNLGGDHGPYYQSQRQSIYDGYYQTLIDKGMAYDCFCSQSQLAITRKMQLRAGQPPRYPGTCRSLSNAQVQAKIAQGLTPTLRFGMPAGQTIRFEDLVKGPQRFQSDDIGDFVIRRADGTAPFMYCNAIDDALMGVTCVLRGEDHLTNTPRQLLLLETLELSLPRYGHISLITDKSGGKLSKRAGSLSIADLKAQGYLPQGLLNYLARLGHTYASNEFMSFAQLAQDFKVEKLGKAPAKFDEQQLAYWQRHAVTALTPEQVRDWIAPVVAEPLEDIDSLAFAAWVQANIEFPNEALTWLPIINNKLVDIAEDAGAILKETPVDFFKIGLEALKTHGIDYSALCDSLKAADFKGKQLFKPLRAALTGLTFGPELKPALALMGQEKAIARMTHALTLLEKA